MGRGSWSIPNYRSIWDSRIVTVSKYIFWKIFKGPLAYSWSMLLFSQERM